MQLEDHQRTKGAMPYMHENQSISRGYEICPSPLFIFCTIYLLPSAHDMYSSKIGLKITKKLSMDEMSKLVSVVMTWWSMQQWTLMCLARSNMEYIDTYPLHLLSDKKYFIWMSKIMFILCLFVLEKLQKGSW